MQISGSDLANRILTSQLAAEQTSQKVAYAVAAKGLDAQRQAGDAIVALIQNAAIQSSPSDSAAGSTLDIRG